MVAAGCSRRPALALRPATPGTAACSLPGSDCPGCISTAHAHLGEQPENITARPGSCLVPRGIPWDNGPQLLTSHEVSRLPLEPACRDKPQQDTGHLCSVLGGQPCPVASLAKRLAGTCAGEMLLAQTTCLPPSPPIPRAFPSAIPVLAPLCWSGRYLTAGGC